MRVLLDVVGLPILADAASQLTATAAKSNSQVFSNADKWLMLNHLVIVYGFVISLLPLSDKANVNVVSKILDDL